MMFLLWVMSMGLLAFAARAQEFQNCSVNTVSPLTIGSTEDAAALATSILACPNGNFVVQWAGEVYVEETIRVTSGTSLDITGAGPGAIANGASKTQLFYIDEDSTLYLSNMTLANGNASTADGDGGAIFVNRSTVLFSGSMSFIFNSAANDGGAVYAIEDSTVSWNGHGTNFSNNAAGDDGGAVYVRDSAVSWKGDGIQFISNYAGDSGGAICAFDSTVSWDGDGALFSNNYAKDSASGGGAIFAYESTVSWDGDGTLFSNNSAVENGGGIYSSNSTVSWGGGDTLFSNNSAGNHGGAIFAYLASKVSWDGDGTLFRYNSAWEGGAIHVSGARAYNSPMSWSGNSTQFISNSAGNEGGAIYTDDSAVSWDGGDTMFTSNSAGNDGGAIMARESTVFWNGDDTLFVSNSAAKDGGVMVSNSLGGTGGAISTFAATVSWNGDRTLFSNNYAGIDGGAIGSITSSSVSWAGDSTYFSNNSAREGGGAISAYESTLSWDGDDVLFSNNYAGENGGAIAAHAGWYESTVSVFWSTDGTLFSNNSAGVDGGAIFADGGSIVSWDGDDTLFSNNYAGKNGGAIATYENSTVSWSGNGTLFTSNSAGLNGGALSTDDSILSWNGDDTLFSSNFAGEGGGAITAWLGAKVSWNGDGTRFGNNSADLNGGAISTDRSVVSWGGNGTVFSSNYADYGGVVFATDSTASWVGEGTLFTSNHARVHGGAIAAYNTTVFWDGDGTVFSENAANERGGAIYGYENATLSWDGDATQFSNNIAGSDGGALCASFESTVSCKGDGTLFSSNNATKDGGAIFAVDSSKFCWSGNPTFSNNVAGANGGALAIVDIQYEYDPEPFIAATFIKNRAAYGGGAVYILDCEIPLNFTDVMFQSNFASGAGGAVSAQFAGDESSPVAFTRCTFSQNEAANSGGAVEILSGHQEFESCRFEGNSADIGGAMILGGITTVVRECSFLSNSVSSRGLAVAVVGSVEINGSTFDGNELDCASGLLYREDTEEGGPNKRYEAVCFDCPDWDECSGCTMTRGDVKPVCEVPLEHTTAEGPGVTVETLTIARGYWRATNQSESILSCYNADACIGGATGADGYCSPGYMGPYCAVCETGYSSSLAHTCTRCSSSRRQGLMAATAIGALLAVLVVGCVCRYVLSAELEEGERGCFRRRVLRAVPLQALKIVVVVWQILTQFAEAANLSYPGVYQEILYAVSIVNFDLGSVLSAGCLWSEIDFHGRLLVSTVWPLVAVGFLSITYWIAMRRIGTTADDAGAVEAIRRKHQTVLLLLTFLVYSSVSSMVFQTFACETLDDGVEYLRADYSIQCTDPKHKAFEVYAGIMVMVYPVGIPLLYAVQLFQHRGVLADDGADKAAAQPIVGLWEPYTPERFYYEVVECGRRIMLTGVVVFIFPNDAAQVAITLLIAVFFFGVLEVLSPYKSESDMWLSRGGHVLVFLSMFYMLLLKVDVSGERDESQAVFAGVFVAGHVLMVLSILVEVVGVCYASRKKEVGEKGMSSEVFPLRARAGSDDVPVFETAPSKSWKSFLSRSVSDEPGPTRRVAATETGV